MPNVKQHFEEFDEVRHPILGLGYVDEVKTHPSGIQYALIIEWDEDPPITYNMGDNPSLMFPIDVTVVDTIK